MEDKLSLVLEILCTLSLIILIISVWREYSRFARAKQTSAVRQETIIHGTTEYGRIQNATKELESDFQTNFGVHHPEEVYIKRANLIRKETSWYKLVNSL